jgi:predicted HTH domain antitoxin
LRWLAHPSGALYTVRSCGLAIVILLDVSDLMEERYSRLVREAYEQELISIGRAGEMLNLSVYQMRTLVRAWQVPA